MKILLVGGGGREHALATAIVKSPLCETLYCAPGNAGIADVAECSDIKADDVSGLVDFATQNAIDFVVVGPEVPLVAGLADRLIEKNIKVFGPVAATAALEGSKAFMKDMCARYNIPTAAYAKFTDAAQAKAYIEKQDLPIVVKADGLAAGKGVIIAQSKDEAFAAIEDILDKNIFGMDTPSLVIEEFLDGEELSYFVLSDGKNILPLISAQDHKAVGEGDTGPNTGGMGAYSPAPVLTPELEQKVLSEIITPTVQGFAAEGTPYKGVLFAGLMIVGGVPKLLEYNVRFGDPECQVLMTRLQSDIVSMLLAVHDGNLDQIKPQWDAGAAICVVMAAKGYPGAYEKGSVIAGLDQAADDDVTVFHAGTDKNENGDVISVGGRVLGVTARGDDVAKAQARAYDCIDKIDWPQGFCRRDIGWRAIARRKSSAA